MRCYRCSTPTATPLVVSGRDWGSCGSGWGRPAPPTAWPRSPWSWRGGAGPGPAPGDGRSWRTRGRAGRGAARERGGDCRGRPTFLGVVDRVVGSVLPAPAVRPGGDQVQRAVRGGSRKGGAASRDDYGRAGAAGRDVRRAPVTAARVISLLSGPSTAARLTRAPVMLPAGVCVT